MRRLSGAVLATAALLAIPAAAPGASITYVGPDGNVHLTSPDGAVKRQVTTDGSPSKRYEVPSLADDGTVVAVSEGTTVADGTKFAQWYSPDGRLIETQPLPTSTGIIRIPAFTSGQVSPDGRFYLYDAAVSPFSGPTRYTTSLIGRVQSQDPCGVSCTNSRVSPRWVGNSGAFMMLDPYLESNGVAVQAGPNASPQFWFDFIDSDAVSSIDEAAGRLAVEAVEESAGTMLSVSTDEPPADLVMARYTGAPGSALPTLDCELEDYTRMPGFARISPDGTMLAWQDREGVYVSPVPPQTGGGTCTLQPRLIAPGGRRPDWGVTDVPAPPPPPATAPAVPQPTPAPRPATAPRTGTTRTSTPASSCRAARVAVGRAEKRVSSARKSVRRWSGRLRTATKARRRAAARTARRKLASARKTVKREERRLKAARAVAKRRC